MSEQKSQVNANLTLIPPEKVLFPDETILDGNGFHVGQDFEVPIPGFYIIAAKRSGVSSFDDFTDEEIQEFGIILRKVRGAMRAMLNIEHVYFFQNEDTAHGFHFWCLPRYEWMKEQFGIKVESVRPILRYAIEHMQDAATMATVRDSAEKMRQSL